MLAAIGGAVGLMAVAYLAFTMLRNDGVEGAGAESEAEIQTEGPSLPPVAALDPEPVVPSGVDADETAPWTAVEADSVMAELYFAERSAIPIEARDSLLQAQRAFVNYRAATCGVPLDQPLGELIPGSAEDVCAARMSVMQALTYSMTSTSQQATLQRARDRLILAGGQ